MLKLCRSLSVVFEYLGLLILVIDQLLISSLNCTVDWDATGNIESEVVSGEVGIEADDNPIIVVDNVLAGPVVLSNVKASDSLDNLDIVNGISELLDNCDSVKEISDDSVVRLSAHAVEEPESVFVVRQVGQIVD